MSSFSGLRKAISEDFENRHPLYHKTRGEGLTLLANLMLETRTPNLNELAEALPRKIGTPHDGTSTSSVNSRMRERMLTPRSGLMRLR